VAPKSAQGIDFVVGLLRKAVIFRLPDNGIIIDSEFKAIPSVFHLPYPVVAAEFYCPGDRESGKCIALAFEKQQEDWDGLGYNVAGISKASISLIAIECATSDKEWAPSPWMLKIPNQNISLPHLRGVQVELLPEIANSPRSYPDGATKDEMYQSNARCVCAILNLIEVLSCANTSIETIPAPKTVNKKRIANGKLPFYEYKILTLDPAGQRSQVKSNALGTHASPRVHLRRGHIRRLRDKKIWINATVVGNRKSGMVVKDYEVKA